MMIAITGLIAHAGFPLPSLTSSPKYVLYPPTNLTITIVCAAWLNWQKPQGPGGITPAGLLGYRIYCDGVLIHYIPNPDTLEYWDYLVNNGTFTDSVTAYYDLTSYGYPGEFGESAAAFATSTEACGPPLPFFEPWNGGSFGYQSWKFIPSQGNWIFNINQGNPVPTASFSGTPLLVNYDYRLYTVSLVCSPWNCANIYIEYDSRSSVNNPTGQEKMITEVYSDNIWQPKDILVNDISTGWIHHKIDITDIVHDGIRIGFRAIGINSADIAEWDVDNINVYAVCYKPPDFNLNRIGNSIHLSWGIPCIGKKIKPDQVDSSTLLGYNVYRTDYSGLPPFVKLNMAIVTDTEYIDVISTTFDGVVCYYVTAVYQDSLNPGSILCEPHSDTLCADFAAGIPIENSAQIRIFPNPVSDMINIGSDEPFTSIEVLNFLGEKIYSESFPGTTNAKFLMKDNPTGIYMLKINFRQGMVVMKVVKKE